MTPEQAVEALIAHGIVTPNKFRTAQPLTLGLFKAVQQTETRRCAALAKDWGTSSVTGGDTATHRRCRRLAKAILTTGGLEAEE